MPSSPSSIITVAHSDQTDPEVVAAVGTGGVVLNPPLDALVVEAVLAAGQHDAAVVPLELHEADGAGAAHVRVARPDLRERLAHVHDLAPLALLQVLARREQRLGHQPVDLPAGVPEDHGHEEEDEEEVGSDEHDQVVLAKVIEGGLVRRGVKLLEELAEEEERAEEDGQLVVAVLLEAHEPPVGNDQVLQPDHVDRYCRQVQQVLPDPVLVPVRDRQDQQRQRDQRLDDAREVLLDHQFAGLCLQAELREAIENQWNINGIY